MHRSESESLTDAQAFSIWLANDPQKCELHPNAAARSSACRRKQTAQDGVFHNAAEPARASTEAQIGNHASQSLNAPPHTAAALRLAAIRKARINSLESATYGRAIPSKRRNKSKPIWKAFNTAYQSWAPEVVLGLTGDSRKSTRSASWAFTRRESSKRSSYRSGPDDNTPNGFDDERREHVIEELSAARLALSLFAVLLLWATSLRTVSAILQGPPALIPAPEFDVVATQVDLLVKTTFSLRKSYIGCIADSLLQCNHSLHFTASRERSRVSAAQEYNAQVLIPRAERLQRGCAAAHSTAVLSVEAWSKARPLPGNAYKPSCTIEDQLKLQRLTNDLQVEKAETYGLIEKYAGESSAIINLLADQIEARSKYDAEYLYNKTVAGLTSEKFRIQRVANLSLQVDAMLASVNISELLACATLSPTYQDCPGQSIRERVAYEQRRLMYRYEEAVETWEREVDNILTFSRYAVDMVEDALTKFIKVARWMDKYIPSPNGPAIELTGISFNPYTDFQLDMILFDPDAIVGISAPASLDFVYSLAQVPVDAYLQSFKDAFVNVSLGVASLNADMRGVELFADYNPPTIDALSLKSKHANDTNSFQQSSAEALRQIGLQENEDEAEQRVVTLNLTFAGLVQSVREIQWFTQVGFEDPGFDYKWIQELLILLSDCVLIFDIIYRVLQTLSILRRFWARSNLPVAPVDVMTDNEVRGRNQVAFTALQRMALLATHPSLLSAIGIAAAVTISIVAYVIYAPLFNQYYEGCVKREVHAATGIAFEAGSGTILARNAYAVAFNFASFEGNRDRLSGLEKYDYSRQATCTRAAERSVKTQERHALQLQLALDDHARTSAEISLMARCYDLPRLDAEFQLFRVSDDQGKRFPLLSETLDPNGASQLCYESESNSSLKDGIYSCAALPDCEIPCDDLADDQGVDLTGLGSMSIGTACTAEWWFHSQLLKAVFSVAIYLFLNLFRVLVMMGLCRLLWSQLNTGLYAYLATCDRAGRATYKQADLQVKLTKMLENFHVVGFSLVVIAGLLQVPWIVALITLAPKVAYRQLA